MRDVRDSTARNGPVDVAVLFVDLIGSSEFASVLSLRQYADYVESFGSLCLRQCEHYFSAYLGEKYKRYEHFDFRVVGDELVVFMHTDYAPNDVYQLTCLAVAIKCGWLGSGVNGERAKAGLATAELACGINHGTVWAKSKRNRSRQRRRG